VKVVFISDKVKERADCLFSSPPIENEKKVFLSFAVFRSVEQTITDGRRQRRLPWEGAAETAVVLAVILTTKKVTSRFSRGKFIN